MDNIKSKEIQFLNPDHILKHVGLIGSQTVADLGCGGGYFVFPAARLVGDHGLVYGVDVLKTALSSVDSKARLFGLSNIKLVWANVEIKGAAKEIKNKSVDLALLIQLLSQSKAWDGVFQEAERIAKFHGVLLIVDWKSDKLKISPQKDKHVPVAKVKELAFRYGFKLESEFEPSPYHFGMIFRKIKLN